MGKQIVLLGTAPASMALAPRGGEWEIWACSPGTYGMPQIDKFFELHRWEPQQEWFSEGYMQFLKDFKGEVIMTEMVDDIPNCTLLKHEELIEHFGPYFFTSSLAWMCAMAILERPDKIAFYGVDMAATTEYENQRSGCQYFAQLARALGIEVGVPPESDLFRPAPLYGVCEQSHAWIKSTARARELAGRKNVLEKEAQERLKQIAFIQGAMDDQDWHLHSFIGTVDSLGRQFCEPPLVPALLEVQNPVVGRGVAPLPPGNGEDKDLTAPEKIGMGGDLYTEFQMTAMDPAAVAAEDLRAPTAVEPRPEISGEVAVPNPAAKKKRKPRASKKP